MRIREPFAPERESGLVQYKPKFFIASEGNTTEPKYFEKLNQSTISENVTIINILRDYANLGNSNPTYITNLLKQFLSNVGEETTVLELKNRISNWVHENPNKIDKNKVFLELDNIYKNDEYRIHYSDLEQLFMKLFKSDIYKDIAENFTLYFLAQDFTYSETTDSLNMVIDRDKSSFTENQYDDVVDFCNKNNVNLYVSNPCFEFWLFLHFDEIKFENREKLLENPKVNSSRRYIEKRLNEICGYRKNKFLFEKFEPQIKKAILREKEYEENIFKLKDSLGTNVGKLVEKIINYQ